MAPKNTNDDLLAFDDLYSMPILGSRSMEDSVAPNSPSQQQTYAAAKQTQTQPQAQPYLAQSVGPSMSMDEFSFMGSPVPSMVTTTSYVEPPSIEQCFSSPEFSSYGQNPKHEEAAPWDIQQCHTAPDLESENPFDVFDCAPAPAPAPATISPSQDLVQSPTQDSAYSYFGFYSIYPMSSASSTDSAMFDQESRRPSCAAPAPPAEQQASSLIAVNKVPVKSADRQSSMAYNVEVNQKSRVAIATPAIATEVQHQWSEQARPSAAATKQQYSFEDEDSVAMDTYRQGMKGDHGNKAGISLSAGMTNASGNGNNIPTKIPLCFHKDLDKIKQQAKIERARAKIAEKKERKTRPEQKCKGLRSVFGSPKELNKRPKTDPNEPKVVMNPNITKSTAKGSWVKLIGSPKPLQKQPNDSTKNLFV